MRFLDANIFVRYITLDDPEKAEACLGLFERVSLGEEEVLISEVVVAEVVYVLSSLSLYRMRPPEISLRLRALLGLRGIRIAGKTRCLRALELYGANPFLGFEDALAVAYMEDEGIGELYSYDRDFDRVAGIARVEP